MIFMSWRRISGYSMMALPKRGARPRATIASLRQRRIIAAARTPCESRDRFTWSSICLNPSSTPPTRYATAPSSMISPLAIERVPSLSLSRTMR